MRDHTGIAMAARQTVAEPATTPLQDLVAEIAARRDEFDRLSHIPREIIRSMKRAGIFRAGTPKRFGGNASPPAEFLRMVETIAVADGSAAWVAAFGSANTYIAALPVETQRLIYADGPDQVYAGGLYPLQPARVVEGGVRVTGRWRFASGCMGADWIGVGISADRPLLATQPEATTYMAVARANEVEIVENWDVVGMQGTGSHDTRVTDKFYALDWICARGAPGLVDEPLYRYPALSYQAEVHAAVNIGLARAALDVVTEMSGGAKIMPGAARLADRSYYKSELARGEASWRSARAFFYESAERAWNVLLAGDPVPRELENLLRLSATHAAHTSAEIVQQAYRIAGMAAIHKSHRLQRIVRDSMVVTQHASLSEGTYEAAGALFAGVMPGMPYP
ncbi:acyl-CoA dehydrogenase family protein [Bradyrhizobium commune]|uniref:Acyl-CoA dehydrogenase family protein n=1 Tax=Bradyrhizobium commune TaxID=83627 RepID=A0A7S9H145_9BRAD|nr:acyl-CoA dehydrogenase family protein [Bradyrhizobium commune]QPF92365.1 acyl-CoA dehydrogenase family protein [Bradyrhizobium commune]